MNRILCVFTAMLLISSLPPDSGVSISGTHYSNRLAVLIGKVENQTKCKVQFAVKTGGGDNNVVHDGAIFRITIAPGSSEDDIAHELMHPLLESEGHARVFMLPSIPLSSLIHQFIVSDFDHLTINRRLHQLDYYPERGFMKGMREQYRSVLTLEMPQNPSPERRAFMEVGVIHELMKHVYYVKSPAAEDAILQRFPEYKTDWAILKGAIDLYLANDTPKQEWALINTYDEVMDAAFQRAGSQYKLSGLIGFSPLPVSRGDFSKSASVIFRTDRDTETGITRVYAGRVMVGAVSGQSFVKPNGSVSEFAKVVGVDLLPIR